MRTAFFVGCVSIGIILLLGIPKRVFAASCSVSASGSLVPGVSGDVTVSVQNTGSDTISWVYLYADSGDMEMRSASPQGAWVGSVQDPQRVEYTGGVIDPSNTTSFSLSIVGNTVGTYSLAVQAAQSSDGSGRVDCGSVSINVAEAPTVGIANIVVTEVGSSTVKVTWTTDTAATATISYGKTTEYGLTATQSTVSTSHSVSLGDLDANTTYHYRVQSSADGVTEKSTDQTFVTAKAGSTGANQPASSTTSTSSVAAVTPTPLPDRNAPSVRLLTSFAEPFITAPTIRGIATDRSGVDSVSYSLDDGLNWSPVDDLSQRGAPSVQFSFTPQGISDDNYPIRIRAVDTNGNGGIAGGRWILVLDTIPPRLSGAVITAGSVVLDPDEGGVIDVVNGFRVNVFLRIAGGPVSVTLQTGSVKTELGKNMDTGLWQGSVTMDLPEGTFDAVATAVDGAGNVTTQSIAVFRVARVGVISDGRIPISGASVSVYEKNSVTNGFVLWDGTSYSRINPILTDPHGAYSLILPPGTYYVRVKKAGYQDAVSNIVTYTKPTPLVQSFSLVPSRRLTVGPWAFSLPDFRQSSVVLPNAKAIPKENLPSPLVQKRLPLIELFNGSQRVPTTSFTGVPTVFVLLGTWVPDASFVLSELEQVAKRGGLRPVAVFSDESPSAVSIFAKRGGYTIPLLSDRQSVLAGLFGVRTVPWYVFTDKKGNVVKTAVGMLSADDMIR